MSAPVLSIKTDESVMKILISRTVSIELEELRKKDRSILVAGGAKRQRRFMPLYRGICKCLHYGSTYSQTAT